MEFIFMFKQLWKYASTERWKVVVYIFFHTISILGTLGQPLAFAMMINDLQRGGPELLNKVFFWLTIYFACFAVSEISLRTARLIERHVAFRNKKRFVSSMYEHLQSLSLEWHSQNHSGDIIGRVNRAADALFYFSQSQDSYINVIVNFIMSGIILAAFSPIILIATIIVGILIIMFTKIFYKYSVPAYRMENELFYKVASTLQDYVSNITTIVTLRLGKLVKADLEKRIDNVFPYLRKELNLTTAKCVTNALLVAILNIGLIYYYISSNYNGGHLVMLGNITAIFTYIGILISSFEFYAFGFENIIHWKADFEGLANINAEKPNQVNSGIEVNAWEKIHVNIDRFQYQDGKYTIKDIHLNLQKAKKIAFVGESGGGKSSVLKLLRGLYPVEEGYINVNDKKLSVNTLANMTALIPQEPEIFENTIRYNITLGIDTNDEEVYSAMKIAGFMDVLNRLPNGIETNINENGVNLSGGEKQRLALARGIFAIKTSTIVLLDEPTNSVDSKTELEIYNSLLTLLSDKCVISVLHRLHLVQKFDYVYVFSNGTIVEEGTFSELRNKNGVFSELWNAYQVKEKITGKLS